MQTIGEVHHIKTEDSQIDFVQAKELAKQKARQACADPMLLSWYDRQAESGYPNLECGGSDKPAWIVYAESRGGNLTVNINDGQYLFYYLMLP